MMVIDSYRNMKTVDQFESHQLQVCTA